MLAAAAVPREPAAGMSRASLYRSKSAKSSRSAIAEAAFASAKQVSAANRERIRERKRRASTALPPDAAEQQQPPDDTANQLLVRATTSSVSLTQTFKYVATFTGGGPPGYVPYTRGCYYCDKKDCCYKGGKCKCGHSPSNHCGGSSDASDMAYVYGIALASNFMKCPADSVTCTSGYNSGQYTSCYEPNADLNPTAGVIGVLFCPTLGALEPSVRLQNVQGLSQSTSQPSYNSIVLNSTSGYETTYGVDLASSGLQVECTYTASSAEDFLDDGFITAYRGYFVAAGTTPDGPDGSFPYSFQRSSSKTEFAGKLWYQNIETYLNNMAKWFNTDNLPLPTIDVTNIGVNGNSVIAENSEFYWSFILPNYCPRLSSTPSECPYDLSGTFTPASLYADHVDSSTGQFKQCSNFFHNGYGVVPDVGNETPGNYSFCSDVLIGRNFYSKSGATSAAVTAEDAASIVKATCSVTNVFDLNGTEEEYQAYVVSGCNNARPAGLDADTPWYAGAPSTGYNECSCVATSYPNEIVQPYQFCVFQQAGEDTATCGNLGSLCSTSANAGCWFRPCWEASTYISTNQITSSGLLTSTATSDQAQLALNCNCNVCANISCNNMSTIEIDQFTQTVQCGTGSGSGSGSSSSVCSLGYSSGSGDSVQEAQGFTFVYGTLPSVSAEAEDGSIYSANLMQMVIDLKYVGAKSTVLSAIPASSVLDYEALASAMDQQTFIGPTSTTVVPFPTCAFTDSSCFDKTSSTAAAWRLYGKSNYKSSVLIKVNASNSLSALNAQYNPVNCAYAYTAYDDAVKGATSTIASDTLPHGWAFVGVFKKDVDTGVYTYVSAEALGLTSAASDGTALLQGSSAYGVSAEDVVLFEYLFGTVPSTSDVTPSETGGLSTGAIALIVFIAVLLILVIVLCTTLLGGESDAEKKRKEAEAAAAAAKMGAAEKAVAAAGSEVDAASATSAASAAKSAA